MNINDIARTLLNLRETRMTSFIMMGDLREALGFDGYAEALRRRWISPDETGSGMMTVTNHMTTVAEIRQLASENKECCNGCKKDDCTCMCKDGKCVCKSEKMEALGESAHHLAASHAYRKNPIKEYATMGLGRTGDAPETPVPGLGNAHSQPTATIRPPVAAAGAGPSAAPGAAPAAAAAQPAPGADRGGLSAQMTQAEALAQRKFGRPFAQLSPDQQAQVENDMQSAPPAQ